MWAIRTHPLPELPWKTFINITPAEVVVLVGKDWVKFFFFF